MKRTLTRYALGLLLAVLTVALIIVAGQQNIAFSDIKLYVDGEEVEVHTDADTVQDVLLANQIKLNAHDHVNYDLDQKIIDGMNIEISRAVDITVVEGNKRSLVKTHEKTVADVLKRLNTTISEYDLVQPHRLTPVSADMVITIQKVEFRERTLTKTLPFVSQSVEDAELTYGQVKKLRDGRDGEVEYTVREKLIDGKVIGKEVLTENIITQPVAEVIAQGTYVETAVVSRAQAEPAKTETVAAPAPQVAAPAPPVETAPPAEPQPVVMLMTATAYNDVGTTFSGLPSGPGRVAVDPSVIPIGTRLYIEGVDGWPDYGEAVAADTGSAVIGNIIDLWYADYQTCIDFGRRTVRVTILP